MLSVIDKTYKNARIPPSKWQKVDLQLTPTQIKKAQQGLYGKPTEGKEYWETIFKEFKKKNTINVQDKLRMQTRTDIREHDCSWWEPIELKLQQQLEFIYPDLEIVLVKILWSKENCSRQTWHMDYTEFDFARFAGVISLFDDTKFLIKNGRNQADTELRLLKGEMIVFRGDLFHAGAAYEKENRRIYFKAIPRGTSLYKREFNNIGTGLYCEEVDGGCGFKCSTKTELCNHKSKCEKWQKVMANKKRKRG